MDIIFKVKWQYGCQNYCCWLFFIIYSADLISIARLLFSARGIAHITKLGQNIGSTVWIIKTWNMEYYVGKSS